MTSVAPAQRAAPQMTHTPDHVITPEAQAPVSADDARPTRPTLREQISENLLLSLCGGLILVLLTFFGTVVVALLIFNLNSINDRLESIEGRIDHLADRIERLEGRIDGVEMSLGERIDRLEDKVDAGFAVQGAQIAELDRRLSAQIAELDRRLSAQIAELDRRLSAQISELDRKLTALIAHLNATEAVDAALEHRLLIPGASALDSEGEPPG